MVEVDNHLEIAIALKYLDEKTIDEIGEKLNELFAKLSKLIEKVK